MNYDHDKNEEHKGIANIETSQKQMALRKIFRSEQIRCTFVAEIVETATPQDLARLETDCKGTVRPTMCCSLEFSLEQASTYR